LPASLLPAVSARGAFARWPRRRFLAAALAGTAAGTAQAQFRVEIAGIGARQIPVAVGDFRDEAVGGVPIGAIVRANLERSGLFRSETAAGVGDETGAVDTAAWRGRGLDAVVAGSVTRLADGRFDVRHRLWDVVRGQAVAGQSKVVLPQDLRLAAHRIADEIQLALTGEPGVNATRIAFVVKTGRRFTLHVGDADGQGVQVALASNEPIISPAWSADGARLAYVSFESQKAVVWVQSLATGERRKVADFRGSNSAPAFSPDGRALAVALARGGVTQLHLLQLAEPSAAPVPIARSNAIDTEPVFAPDGRSLYFVSDRGGGPQIYRAGVDGREVQRISFDSAYAVSPAVSPDGRQLAYVSRQGNAYRLVLQDLSTGAVTPLTDTVDDESPSFAPNGRLLLYATRQRGTDVLMTTTLDGRIKTRLLTSGADMREPAWGPYVR
jgi:TolB protein